MLHLAFQECVNLNALSVVVRERGKRVSDIFRWLKHRTYTNFLLGYLKATQAEEQKAVKERSDMARSLEFIFQFPPIYGAFDTGFGIVYIFGELHENEIEDIIVHETLHYALLKVAGKKASLRLDRIYGQITG